VTEQATDKDWAAVGDFAASLRTKAIRDRLNEIGFNGAAGDVVVVCPPGSPLQSSAGMRIRPPAGSCSLPRTTLSWAGR
jgi:hypothetical protein